jgi:arylsulfatase
VDLRAAGAAGVIFAHGSRFGGHALYVTDNRLHYVNNFVGLADQDVAATEDLPTGTDLIVSASFEKDGEEAPGVATGILSLYHADHKVGEGRIKTQAGAFALAGEGLCVGLDSGAAVTDDYPGEWPRRFTGGVIKRVVVDVSGETYRDMERAAQAMLVRE